MGLASGSSRSLAWTVLRWAIVFLGLWNLGRAFIIGRQLDWLVGLTLSVDPRVRLVIASAWGVLFLATGLFLGRRTWVQRAAPFLIAGFGITELIMTSRFASDSPVLFPVLAYGVFVAWSFWVLWPHAAVKDSQSS